MTKKQYKVGFFDEPTDVDDYVEYDGQYLTCSDVVDLLNEKEEQLQLFIELAKKHNKTIDELYRFMRDYLNSRNENTYWNPELRYRKW